MAHYNRILILLFLLAAAVPVLALPTTWTPDPLYSLSGGLKLPELRGERDRPAPQGRLGLEREPDGNRRLLHALWRSAVLPGWGQHYLGAPTRGALFLASEAGVWGTWGTFKIQQKLRMDNSIEMAEVFAGVSGNHDDDYYKNVGQYKNWQDYNEGLRWDARREYGFGTDEYYAWIAENEIAEDDAWNWANEDRRIAYVLKRKSSKTSEQRATNTLFALIITRVGAMVDTWRLSRTHDDIRRIREEETGGRIRGSLEPGSEGMTLRLGWTRSF